MHRRLNPRALLWLILFTAPFCFAAVTLINLATQVTGVLPVANGGTGNVTGQSTNTFLQTQLASAVTLGTSSYTPSSGTFPSVTTATAGTWVVMSSVTLQTTSAATAFNFTCELYDGTSVLASGYDAERASASTQAGITNRQMALHAIIAESGAVTFTVRCTSTTASQLMEAAATNNSGGSNASMISALRIK